MKQDSNTLTTRDKSLAWWRGLTIQRQTFMAAQHKPEWEFEMVASSSGAIEKIYLSEHPEQSLPSKEVDILDKFINEIKEEFKDENWDYLTFIAERVRNKNEPSKEETIKEENTRLKERIEVLERNKIADMTLALEFGYLQCEKGNNLQMAFINFNKTINNK